MMTVAVLGWFVFIGGWVIAFGDSFTTLLGGLVCWIGILLLQIAWSDR